MRPRINDCGYSSPFSTKQSMSNQSIYPCLLRKPATAIIPQKIPSTLSKPCSKPADPREPPNPSQRLCPNLNPTPQPRQNCRQSYNALHPRQKTRITIDSPARPRSQLPQSRGEATPSPPPTHTGEWIVGRQKRARASSKPRLARVRAMRAAPGRKLSGSSDWSPP